MSEVRRFDKITELAIAGDRDAARELPTAAERMLEEGRRLRVTAGRVGTIQRMGHVRAACPDSCGGIVDTSTAAEPEQIPDIPNGLRWINVLCDRCGKSYTIEMTDDQQEGLTL